MALCAVWATAASAVALRLRRCFLFLLCGSSAAFSRVSTFGAFLPAGANARFFIKHNSSYCKKYQKCNRKKRYDCCAVFLKELQHIIISQKNNSLFCTNGQVIFIILILSKQHIANCSKGKNRRNNADNMMSNIAREQTAELIYNKRNQICKAALIANCKPGPFCIVHFSLDCADCRKAGCAEKVENKI